ncbi:hypothetical protein F4779DRAFT_227987 [Xylariaceae sp. FL0662B]|nr:hypothetical protein F4779DRAFT_227987 [Xylariaceae sp. FL0662B]
MKPEIMSQGKEPTNSMKPTSEMSSTELASTDASSKSITTTGKLAMDGTAPKNLADQETPSQQNTHSQRRVVEKFDPPHLPVNQAEFDRDCQRLGLRKGLHHSRHAN